jgi:hypothetical protein
VQVQRQEGRAPSGLSIIGLPAPVVRESGERVCAALHASEDEHALIVPAANGSKVARSGQAAAPAVSLGF